MVFRAHLVELEHFVIVVMAFVTVGRIEKPKAEAFAVPYLFPIAFFLISPPCYNSHVAAGSAIVNTKVPIVIYDNGVGSVGSADDTYFGYSLAFMKGSLGEPVPSVSLGTTSDQRGTTVFIAAPKEKRAAKNSGVVWQCRFKGSEAKLTCFVMTSLSEQKSSDKGKCKTRLNTYFPEKESEQWIGASLSTSGRGLYACAPRWKMNGWTNAYDQSRCDNETALVGGCYLATNQQNVQLHTPLRHPKNFHYTTPQSTFSEYWYLYAEAGFSSHVVTSSVTQDVLLGAPGNRKWRGAIIENPKGEMHFDFVHNKEEEITEVEPHGLFGYSVTSGRHLSMKYYIAGGAPRGANLYGAVVIMRKGNEKRVSIYKGEQLGSYFGYALATADLNSDGYDELLVGAPLFTADFHTSHNTGCVYIYDGRVIDTKEDKQRPLEPWLCPNHKSNPVTVSMGARFGSAITNLGDINKDDKQDFAVSAPYDDEGIGTVFIYLGGRPLSDKPSQVIRGKTLSIPKLYGWGTFLLGGSHVDVDENGTPDLVVAAFESRHTMVLRTRPVVYLNFTRITFHEARSTDYNKQIFKLNPNQQSFRVRICIDLRLSVEPLRNNVINVLIKYKVDPTEKRVKFTNDADYSEHTTELSTSQENCLDKQLEVVKEFSQEENPNPIVLQVTFKYNETEESEDAPVQHASLMLSTPRVGVELGKRQEFKGDSKYQTAYRKFEPYRPAPFKVPTSASSLVIANDNCNSSKEKKECDPKLGLSKDLCYQQTDSTACEPWVFSGGKGKALTIGKFDVFKINLKVKNEKETAYRPTVHIEWKITPNFTAPFTPITFNAQLPGKVGQCSLKREDTQTKHIGKIVCLQPLQPGKEMTFGLTLENLNQMKVIGNMPKGELKINIVVYPEGSKDKHKVTEEFQVPLESNVDISVESRVSSTGQSEIDPTKKSWIDLKQVYTIENKGFSSTEMDKVVATIWVPSHVRGKPVIGVANPSIGDVRCEAVNFTFFQPRHDLQEMTFLNLSIDTSHARSRSRRSTSKGAAPEKISLVESSDNFMLLSGCNQDAASIRSSEDTCQKLRCYLQLPSKGRQEIEMIMYLLPDAISQITKEDTRGVRVESLIKVSFLGKTAEHRGSTERKFLIAQGVPAWIYLASGASGMILFLLITFTLFKCGFFRRNTKAQLKALKRQTLYNMDTNALMMLDASINGSRRNSAVL